ncbi:UNVERIFIED_CONTAM: hypothetical protein Scaly_2427200 [Sesamum calycinum]|uniref:DUF4283 domain-containing protein n=1 Tax=Sesamum calycinum TaxID=2727403 RepID=A0AAW2M067_9LAMI
MSLTSRALDGCPWSFKKNILILNAFGENENLMQVDLEKCDFFVHIHDLPLNMMNLGVATLIENRIRIFWDMEADNSGCSWGASLRIGVGLNVNQPLKRDLKIWSTSGEELLVHFTYKGKIRRQPCTQLGCGEGVGEKVDCLPLIVDHRGTSSNVEMVQAEEELAYHEHGEGKHQERLGKGVERFVLGQRLGTEGQVGELVQEGYMTRTSP